MALPQHLRGRLASALEAGTLRSSSSVFSLRAALGLRNGGEDVLVDLANLDRMGVSGRSAAAWLRTVEQVSARSRRPDLVWSGPELPGVPARDTERVFEEIMRTAEHSLWVSAYVYFDGPQMFADLAQRLDTIPGFQATLLLNIQRRRGDNSADQLVRRFADRFWTKDWPGSSQPDVHYDPRSLDIGGPGGVLHAKAVVADGETLFVTSANLTDAAQKHNIELGVLIRDRTLAASVESHFQGLIDRRLLKPLPST